MKIIFNGKELEVKHSNLYELLVELEIIKDPKDLHGFAVSINENIISKQEYQQFEIKDQDQMDVFYMMAGGSNDRSVKNR